MRLVIRWLLKILLALSLLSVSLWCTFAIYFRNEPNVFFQFVLSVTFALCTLIALAAIFMPRYRLKVLAGYSGVLVVFFLWWFNIDASNDRQWQPEQAKLATAEINDNLVTVRNIRNFDYRTEQDFTPAYYDSTFDVNTLKSMDLIAVYWMGPEIAHIMVSFGFEDGRHLAFSIETRKEVGESYSTLRGFFRQYELYYVVADERDVIRLRTNYRDNPPEHVYVFPALGSLEDARRMFMAYMDAINSLAESPRFYNTLTTNCTTNIWFHSLLNPGHVPLSWKLLLSGYVPEYLYQYGKLDQSLPFEELRQAAFVNERAKAAGNAEDFSRRIREGIPVLRNW